MLYASTIMGEGLGLIFPGFYAGDGKLTTRVTSDGEHILFADTKNLTSFNQNGYAEIYLYDAQTKDLTCVSCNPAGTAPASEAITYGYTAASATEQSAAAPVRTGMSDDGRRVFFTSPDQLTSDAPAPSIAEIFGSFAIHAYSLYEWENGHIYLISAGDTGGGSSFLLGTTPSGDDVFFTTARSLVPSDTDGTLDVYDARMNGGFAQLIAPACSGGGCQGLPGQPPIFATPASVTFNGVGNFAESSKPAKKVVVHKKKRAKNKRKRKRARRAGARGKMGPNAKALRNGGRS
jgi:hypothetical protein